MHAHLRVVAGPDQGRVFNLIEGTTLSIGRGDTNDLALHDEFASARHARFEPRRDGVYVQDVGSTNGTFVNGQPVRRVVLTDGTQITLGRTTLVFRQERP